MKFLIVGHVVHKEVGDQVFAYGPYVKEMNVWGRYVEEIGIVAPFEKTSKPNPIDLSFQHAGIKPFPVSSFDTISASGKIKTILTLPGIILNTMKAMRWADHIHLRCPGNMGLVGCVAQVFFPSKVKTAKYAGNWDKGSYRPKSYQIQQSILGNTSLSKKMTALVYGNWPNESQNIKPFFTASYSEKEKESIQPRNIELGKEINLLFVGTLDSGKQPQISVEVCKKLREKRINARLDLYGEGNLSDQLKKVIENENLQSFIKLHGNRPSDEIKMAYKNSHFLIFISKSEGWPKAVAEAMFWACLPITTRVSCVPQMLGNGERGELVNEDVNEIFERLENLIENPSIYKEKAAKAMGWSRDYTLEKFESEIKKLLLNPAD
ncbi:glycosyltransferase [Algoriphagus sediminis]|uniref:Glycosyltransferase n=1 Tax=Algoriphagus sediminis TaxID=3057113 RepID=A0ABT7YDZ4_9BACT|nr:glycosyltransferase [Algoriphagus sediminis]MDN3204739.1 glycosyltransferase [Algoriphagus sediminis]